MRFAFIIEDSRDFEMKNNHKHMFLYVFVVIKSTIWFLIQSTKQHKLNIKLG